MPGTEVFYSIQGTSCGPGEVVPQRGSGLPQDDGRDHRSRDGGDGGGRRSGGDSRCTCPPWPDDGSKPAIPCDGKTAHVAYILMAEQGDTSGDSHNNGKYAMYLTVSQPAPDHGANVIRRWREPESGQSRCGCATTSGGRSSHRRSRSATRSHAPAFRCSRSWS